MLGSNCLLSNQGLGRGCYWRERVRTIFREPASPVLIEVWVFSRNGPVEMWGFECGGGEVGHCRAVGGSQTIGQSSHLRSVPAMYKEPTCASNLPVPPHPPGGPELGPEWRGGRDRWQQRWLLWSEQPVREPGAHDPHVFLQGLLLWQAGGGEGGGEAGGVELRAGERPATCHFGGAD